MQLPKLNDTLIREHTSAETFSRGQQYERQGAVTSLVMRGNTLLGEVEGGQFEPHRVRVVLDQSGVADTRCTCPYDWGGWCKHIVAVLLAAARRPESVDVRPPLGVLLSDLSRDEMAGLLVRLAERDPALAEDVELQVKILRPERNEPANDKQRSAARATTVDPAPIRRRVDALVAAVRRAEGDQRHVARVINEKLRELLDEARGTNDDPRGALVLLKALTDAYLNHWDDLAIVDQETEQFLDGLGRAWAEALLTAELTRAERRGWAEQIAVWCDDLDEFGLGALFDVAGAAADQGWDTPALRRVLAGTITDQGAWDGDVPPYADALAIIRLRILDRQQRYQEYLYLAEAEGQIAAYLTMLVKVGRGAEAIEDGLLYLATADQALQLARALYDHGELVGAMRIGEHGLKLAEPREPLANWLFALAEQAGQRDLALRALQLAYNATPSLTGYLKVRELAGPGWGKIQPVLLEQLRRGQPRPVTAVDIFLYEGLLDDAIAAVKGGVEQRTLVRVLEAALPQRPDWVIRIATAEADRIMDAGDADHYEDAVAWLGRAREAYVSSGQEQAWHTYLAAVRARHWRKHRLMGLLAEM